MKMSKQDFLRVLDDIRGLIEADDSFDGNLSYSAEGRHEFEVTAFYRTGNSFGQSGSVIIDGPKED